MITSIGEDLKKLILLGIGATAMSAEKAKELIDELIKKGELTLEQGKVLNEELKHNLKEKVKGRISMTVSEEAHPATLIDKLDALSPEELAALQSRKPVGETPSFSKRESLAIEYARLISSTPLNFPRAHISELKQHFNEREIVILATTAAQVNYWTRLIQALGCPPQRFSEVGLYLDLER